MNAVDDSGDQKVSYSELREYIRKLGFDIDSVEGKQDDAYGVKKVQSKSTDDVYEHQWRDKALELVIRAVRAKLDKNQSIFEYFKTYDDDHDVHLTPA